MSKIEGVSSMAFSWSPADSEGEHSITHCYYADRVETEYWTTCMCGWKSEWRQWPSEAHVDAMKHLGRRA